MPADLADLRAAIDTLDTQILSLLVERSKLSLEVGRRKAASSEPVFRPDREQAVVDRLTSIPQDVLPADHIQAIWHEIFASSRNLQQH